MPPSYTMFIYIMEMCGLMTIINAIISCAAVIIIHGPLQLASQGTFYFSHSSILLKSTLYRLI